VLTLAVPRSWLTLFYHFPALFPALRSPGALISRPSCAQEAGSPPATASAALDCKATAADQALSRDKGKLTKIQLPVADRADILMRGLAHTGIIA
jgi:hypothetical protein